MAMMHEQQSTQGAGTRGIGPKFYLATAIGAAVLCAIGVARFADGEILAAAKTVAAALAFTVLAPIVWLAAGAMVPRARDTAADAIALAALVLVAAGLYAYTRPVPQTGDLVPVREASVAPGTEAPAAPAATPAQVPAGTAAEAPSPSRTATAAVATPAAEVAKPAPQPATEAAPPPRAKAAGSASASSETDRLLAAARADLAAGRLTTPAGDNAYEKYAAVLVQDPRNTAAREGIERIVDRYIELFDRAFDEGRVDDAIPLLRNAERINPDRASVRRARERLALYYLQQATPR